MFPFLCPLCGEAGLVIRWHFVQPRRGAPPTQYFSPFVCPEHGWFLCRLTLAQGQDGLWRGRRSVPAVTPELEREYAAALTGVAHVCRSSRGKRRRSKH